MNYSLRRKKREILILSSWWLNGESFVLKRCGDQTINYCPQFGEFGQWNIKTRLWDKISDHLSDYCRTWEPLWLQWDDNDSSGVISAVSRDQTQLTQHWTHHWTHQTGGRFENNFQSWSLPVGHSSHLCLYCRSRRNNIWEKLTFHRHRADLSKQKISWSDREQSTDHVLFRL